MRLLLKIIGVILALLVALVFGAWVWFWARPVGITNYVNRETAEAAAESCQGKAVVQGCPLRVQWGKPKPLDTMEREERIALAKEGRETMKAIKASSGASAGAPRGQITQKSQQAELDSISDLAAPPGSEDIRYASLAGN